MNSIEQAGFYADFTQFHGMRAAARGNPRDPETLRRVAGQFEALFLNLMLKEMRKAAPADSLFDNDQTRFYRGMYDQQIASELTRGRGLGLAELLVRQLGGAGEGQSLLPRRSAPSAVMPRGVRDAGPVSNGEGANGNRTKAGLPVLDVQAWRDGDPERFVADLMPHARRIAARLGVPAEAIVAQAALETGWGRAIPKTSDGRSTYNLFGIKADCRWRGERAGAETLEYREGMLRRERASFRAYESPEASLEDYARFLRENPRYREALDNRDPVAFARALARAGYATDPAYADKIAAILERPVFRETVEVLKPTAARSMEDTGALAFRKGGMSPDTEGGTG